MRGGVQFPTKPDFFLVFDGGLSERRGSEKFMISFWFSLLSELEVRYPGCLLVDVLLGGIEYILLAQEKAGLARAMFQFPTDSIHFG